MTWLGPKQPYGAALKPPLEKRERRKTPAEKRPGKDPDYLALVRRLPCCVCNLSPPSECHHLKCTGERGMGKKSSDKWVIPLCRFHHDATEQRGSKNEVAWFQGWEIDCLTLAASLYANRHSLDAMRLVLAGHRRMG